MIAPPVGIMPKKFWDERRMWELGQAVWRYTEAGLPVPQEWIDEYNDLAFPMQRPEPLDVRPAKYDKC